MNNTGERKGSVLVAYSPYKCFPLDLFLCIRKYFVTQYRWPLLGKGCPAADVGLLYGRDKDVILEWHVG